MRIGGLQKFTLIDYPGKIACTVFSVGCSFRCPWCHNPELVLPEKIILHPIISQVEFFDFLKSKKGLLEGVVIGGGEPTVHKDLPRFIKKIRKIGYLVKLDTNGSSPYMLKDLIDDRLVDFVALDVKAPKEKYSDLVGVEINVEEIEQSINFLKQSDIDFELRTTLVPGLLDKKDILEIVKWISPAPRYVLQNFRSGKTLNPIFEKTPSYPNDYLVSIKKAVEPFFDVCEIR